jgi:hypothetical protein
MGAPWLMQLILMEDVAKPPLTASCLALLRLAILIFVRPSFFEGLRFIVKMILDPTLP